MPCRAHGTEGLNCSECIRLGYRERKLDPARIPCTSHDVELLEKVVKVLQDCKGRLDTIERLINKEKK